MNGKCVLQNGNALVYQHGCDNSGWCFAFDSITSQFLIWDDGNIENEPSIKYDTLHEVFVYIQTLEQNQTR